jgi:DNA-binding HxlR family transcriptional regulator
MSIFSRRFKKEIAPLPPGIEKVTQLISKKWIIDILYILRASDMSFTQLRNELKSISNQELAKKLKLLDASSLVEKHPSFMREEESSTVYVTTVAGKDLCDLIENIMVFGDKYLE